ncbi:MAG: hypothetical protein N3H31_05905 [Candidatus Nezhaarchaeota archaeon]|nr:hypothetical protein [Candidatus Nezhaarchaeota archaeon]
MGLALEYFKCSTCKCVWLDDPSTPEAWRCPSCGRAEHVEKASGGR